MIIFFSILTLSAIGVCAAIILYVTAQKFKVVEDPRIDTVEEVLPQVNCGGCGFSGCRSFAEACVAAGDLSTLYCPVGGNDCMSEVAKILEIELEAKHPEIAVVRCNGTPDKRPRLNTYDGVNSCVVSNTYYIGETGCAYGCVGLGDCVRVCKFDAIYINPDTQLPVVDEEKCTACGACVTACPRDIIELRKKGPKGRRVFVCCINKDKGAMARKACKVACIGCGKCVKECPFDAITLENNCAYINPEKCKLCRKCVAVCPTKAIVEVNFPPKKQPDKTTDIKAAG